MNQINIGIIKAKGYTAGQALRPLDFKILSNTLVYVFDLKMGLIHCKKIFS